MSTKHFQSNVKNFNLRLLIIPSLILMVLIISFTIYLDYIILEIKNYCYDLLIQASKGDFSIIDKEKEWISIVACSESTQQSVIFLKEFFAQQNDISVIK